jgi:hypothetical protein
MLCVVAFLYIFGSKLVARALFGVVRELKATNVSADKLLCLASEDDLSQILSKLPARHAIRQEVSKSLVETVTVALKEAMHRDELHDVLLKVFLAALKDPELKAGVKAAVIDV